MRNANTTGKTRASVTVTPPARPVKTKPPATRAGVAAKATSNVPERAAPKPPGTDVPSKPKVKLVRDSFTIPKSEYAVLEALKLRAATLARPTKKSEMLRAGIVALNAMSDKSLLATLGAVPSIKTGRPKGTAPAKAAKPGLEQQTGRSAAP